MTAKNYSRLAGLIFAIVAVLQLAHALSGWPLSVGTISIPVWASWVACVVAAVLAWAGYDVSRRARRMPGPLILYYMTRNCSY
jgi:hypothetical protein